MPNITYTGAFYVSCGLLAACIWYGWDFGTTMLVCTVPYAVCAAANYRQGDEWHD